MARIKDKDERTKDGLQTAYQRGEQWAVNVMIARRAQALQWRLLAATPDGKLHSNGRQLRWTPADNTGPMVWELNQNGCITIPAEAVLAMAERTPNGPKGPRPQEVVVTTMLAWGSITKARMACEILAKCPDINTQLDAADAADRAIVALREAGEIHRTNGRFGHYALSR